MKKTTGQGNHTTRNSRIKIEGRTIIIDAIRLDLSTEINSLLKFMQF